MLHTFIAPAYYPTGITIVFSIVVVALIGICVWLARRVGRLERHYQSLLEGTDGGNLESLLDNHMAELRSALCQVSELEIRTLALERAGRQAVQHIHVLRFNPFRETGGDQSFVLAITDADGNGAVVSSLHSRGVTRVYAKPIAGWMSVYPLTEEEAESLDQARQK